MKPKPKNPAPVQLELFTIEPRPKKPAAWPTPSGSCYRLRAAVGLGRQLGSKGHTYRP